VLGVEGVDGEELLEEVRRRIEAQHCWVLVLDNADNLGLFGVGQTTETSSLRKFVPNGRGTVLWTSRDKRIAGSIVGAGRAIEVARMTDGEATKLLETVRNKVIGDEIHDAEALLAELDWLPLAVSQVAAYLRRTEMPFQDYLSKLQDGKKRWALLRASEADPHRRQVPNSVLETWNISIQQIKRENRMAYNTLQVLAFLDNENISMELIRKAATGGEGDSDEEEALMAATRLREFSIFSVRADGRTYDMHKLVQEAARYSLSKSTNEARFAKAALRVMVDLFPIPRRELWEQAEMYLVHAHRAAEWAELWNGEEEISALLMRVSDYLYNRGRWREVEAVEVRAYELMKRVLGETHPDTIQSMAQLAVTYQQQGRYDEAEKRCLDVLALQQKVLGTKHPDTLRSMGDLAMVYVHQGKYDEAEKRRIDVLALQLKVLGENHPDTIRSMAGLARIYGHQGKYNEAEKRYIDVIALRRKVFGESHPDTIRSMAHLATTYGHQRKDNEAEKRYIDVIALRRKVLGENHPDTIRRMAELARIYGHQGKYNEAEKRYIDVLALQRNVLGENHPDTIRSMADLAATYHVQEKYDEAEKIKVDILTLRREVLGDRHPNTIRSMASLANTYHGQGKYDEAEKIHKNALKLRHDVLGERHPSTLRSMYCLAKTWYAQGHKLKALGMMEECVQQHCVVLGTDHPYTREATHELSAWKAELPSRVQ
jgi:tetratricopeptide (TPR) repeat protein